jgi:circadian clock protein KaiB
MSKEPPEKNGKYVLRLYIAGSTPRSVAAYQNLRQLCEEHLAGCYDLELIDLLKNPELARHDHILVVPTLVREMPSPIRKFIGDLSHPERVLVDMCLHPGGAGAPAALPEGEHV